MVTTQEQSITLEGSAAIIHEYLKYGVHSIIFQRGIYPSGDFRPEEYNGVPMMVSRDDRIKSYVNRMMEKVQELILKKIIKKITVCIITLEKHEIIERWDFNIKPQYENEETPISNKPLKEIQEEIRTVMRQIFATVSILPCIEKRCTFDIMVHTASNVFEANPNVLEDFQEENFESIEIKNSQTLELKQFSTGFNKVKTSVIYKKA
uniref:HORMA domain-containing protein n=1 Tax=Anopheles minimus TaxID=112268 RepID=A0A182W485_9DIPT